MALLRSFAFSALASVSATLAIRYLLSVSQPAGDGGRRPPATVVIVIPMFAGNSANRIGWVKEAHHHHSLFGFGRRG